MKSSTSKGWEGALCFERRGVIKNGMILRTNEVASPNLNQRFQYEKDFYEEVSLDMPHPVGSIRESQSHNFAANHVCSALPKHAGLPWPYLSGFYRSTIRLLINRGLHIGFLEMTILFGGVPFNELGPLQEATCFRLPGFSALMPAGSLQIRRCPQCT